MLEAKKYTFGELMEVLKESSDRSKPVVGKNVWKDNSQNNVKAVKDIMKQTEEYNDVDTKKRDTNPENIKDLNKSTLDVKFSYEPSKEYKERVKAQVHGFPSVQNEKESKIETENKSVDFEGNKKIYKDNEDKQKERTKNSEEIKQSGLQSHNLPKETFKDKTIFTNENKKMKRLTYNKTFISEAQVLKKIPDDYKTDGNRFIMRDNSGVEYIIECHKDNNVDFIHKYLSYFLFKKTVASSYNQSKIFNTCRRPLQTQRLFEEFVAILLCCSLLICSSI